MEHNPIPMNRRFYWNLNTEGGFSTCFRRGHPVIHLVSDCSFEIAGGSATFPATNLQAACPWFSPLQPIHRWCQLILTDPSCHVHLLHEFPAIILSYQFVELGSMQEVPSPSPASWVIPSNWSVMCSTQLSMLLLWVPSSYLQAFLKRNENQHSASVMKVTK